MNNTTMIILNVKTPVNLRDVAVIEAVTSADHDRLARRMGSPLDRFAAFHSNVRYVDGRNTLVTQTLAQIAAKARNRVIAVRREADSRGRPQVSQIVPIDAIRHFETVSDADRQAMKARYPETDPAQIDALKTRIVYHGLDAKSIEAGTPNQYRKMVPVDLQDDIVGQQKLALLALGHDRFVLASEIEAATDLDEAELKGLSRRYNLRAHADGPLKTTVTLRGSDLILSSLSAQEIAERIRRQLPTAVAGIAKPAMAAAIS